MSNDPRKFKTGIAVTGTATVGGDTVTTNTASQTLVNKTIDADSNTITNISNDEIKAGAGIDAAKIHDGSVSNTEFGYLDGVTSPIQTQLDSNATGLSDHLADTTDAHDASAISNVPTGNLAATDVQSALNELQSDVDTRALDTDVIKKDGSVAFTADQSMGGFKLTSLAAPTASSDAATKGYVDNALEGLRPKEAVRVATTANIVIATALNSGDVIDGITLANGDRVLVKDQTAAEENGIYVVSATPSRSTDFDSLSPIDEINKAYVAVQEGTANAGKLYVQYGIVTTLDTDPINFTFFNSVSGLTGGDGITVSGSNISVDHDGEGLTFVATQLALELDGSTLSKSASGLKVADQGISNAQINNAAAIDYSKLNLSNSIVNADIATGAAIDASKIADGSVSNTEFQYINTLSSNAQTQLDGKASITLNNLGTTSINADLLPSVTAVRNAGSSTLRWNNIHVGTLSSYSSVGLFNSGGTQRGQILAELAMPSGPTANAAFRSVGTSSILGLWTDSGTTSANARLETGNASAGASGNIVLQTGTATTTRGDVVLNGRQVDVSSTKIVNVTDPTNPQDAATKAYVDAATANTGSAGDISEDSFAAANNVASPADVTGLAFANATVRSFKALVSVEIDATADLYESFELLGVQRGSDWSMSISSTGDDSQINFSITNAGQVQYTSANLAGFVSNTIKFRAITLTV